MRDVPLPNVFSSQFKNLDKFFVGFDDQFDRLAKLHDDVTKNVPNYPPYNIRKTGDNIYVIELAVAGFAKPDIDIELNDGKLIISGKAPDEGDNFLFKGIANRAFTRAFVLDEQVEVRNANLINGMLTITLERIIPEHKKPKKIEVQELESLPRSERQLLNEA